jgi:AcrR family transcriptional regulator
MGAKERREREREQRKNDILDTARALLFEKGLNATTINQIAKRAELSVGTIYFYYDSKEDLYATLQLEGLEILTGMIREASEAVSATEEKIRAIGAAYLRFSNEHSNYFEIINYFLTSPETIFSQDLKSRVDGQGTQSISILAEAVAEGIRTGLFRDVDPRRQAIILWGTLHGMLHFKKLQKTILAHADHESIYMEAVERFIDGLHLHSAPVDRMNDPNPLASRRKRNGKI